MRPTEQSHPDTTQMDKASPRQLIGLLLDSELEVFGSDWGPGLSGKQFQNDFSAFQAKVNSVLQSPEGRVFISGAGTSGRLGLAAQITHSHRFPGKIIALLAGGNSAFFEAKEGAEDSAVAGSEALRRSYNPHGINILIGVSCGLSAPFVAGSLKFAMDNQFEAIAILGFNPLNDANSRPLEGLGVSFQDLLLTFPQKKRHVLFNPELGPEPLTGSTRLKGGTATKIFLDILFTNSPVPRTIESYRAVLSSLDNQDPNFEQIVTQASQSMLKGGSLSYFSDQSKALMALLDASECPPTFGSKPCQVRAFFGDSIGRQLSELALKSFHFNQFRAALHTEYDTWVSLDDPMSLAPALGNRFVEKCSHLPIPQKAIGEVRKAPGNIQDPIMESLVKRQLNTLSTATFVLSGKVWRNYMIDLRISNSKLYQRAINIISLVTQTKPEKAREALDNVIEFFTTKTTSPRDPDSQISIANSDKIIPTAIIFLKTGWPIDLVRERLNRYPKVVDILSDFTLEDT